MNKVILVGRLTKDPEVMYTNDGTTVAHFSIAVDRKYKRNDVTADFFNCTAFGKHAERIEKYYTKGLRIGLSGRIETGSYMKGDVRIPTINIVCEDSEFAESKREAESNKPQETKPTAQAVVDDDFMSIPESLEDEVPFI